MESLQLKFQINYKEFAEMDRFFMVSGEILKNLKPMFEKFIPTIRKEIKDQFSAEGKPEKWKELSAGYLASPQKMNSKYPMKILKLTGGMWKAATKDGAPGNISVADNNGLTYGVSLETFPYARLHDAGGKIGGICKGSIMPKREFIKLTKEGVKRIMQKAHKFIRSEMKAGRVHFTGGDGI
ncbi:MAG TPA: hypothetical protein VMV86_01665 [Methanosarcinales archaeon]|nr:hypothetical protein [Methanosarcinales archaeon]